ncbi:hypothetical protein BGW37DRAFT_486851 [Umbelopsis sp. PMI_123]|nr:hypothetical protein BGW37DRAFT_486851 [Umbelopsis sp. PMI_123]
MGMSKLEFTMACSYPFADHGTPLWIDMVTSTSDKAEIRRRRANYHAIVDTLLDCRETTLEHGKISTEKSNSCPTSLKVQNRYINSITDFSKVLPIITQEADNANTILERSLTLMRAIVMSKCFLLPDSAYPFCYSSDDQCDPAITPIVNGCRTNNQENEQIYLSIGRSLENVSEVNDQPYAMQTKETIENLNTVRIMEELLMDILDHMEYSASLFLPSITWDASDLISTVCTSRLSRILQQLGVFSNTAPLSLSLADNHQQHSDMSAFHQLMCSLGMINQWLHGETLRIQAKLKDKATVDRTQLMVTICNKVEQTMDNAKVDFSLFRTSVIELQQHVVCSQQIYHRTRCPDTCYTDRTVTCNNHTREEGISLQQGDPCDSDEVKNRYEMIVLALGEGIDEWIQECYMFEKVFENAWSDLATVNLSSTTLDRLAHLETHLHGIKSSVDSARSMCLQGEECVSKTELLLRLRESQIQIMDVEPRFERICQRVKALEKCKRWECLYNTTMTKIRCVKSHIDDLLEARSMWTTHFKDRVIDEKSANILVLERNIEKAIQEMQLDKVAEAMFQFEETLISAMFKLPDRMYDSQQSLLSQFTQLQSRLLFANNVLQQYKQVTKFQTDVLELQRSVHNLQQISQNHLSVERLNELCKKVISVSISGYTSILYPEVSVSSESRRNTKANQHVRSGIGTMQLTLMSMLDDLKKLIDDRQRHEQLQDMIGQMMIAAGRQIKLLQSRIASLEKSPISLTARISIQELRNITNILQYQQYLNKKPIVICSPAQIKVLQSSEEGMIAYNTQKNLILSLVEQLEQIYSNHLVLTDTMMTRAAWEARYEECAILLGTITKKLPIISQIAWRMDNKDVKFDAMDSTYKIESVEDYLIQEQLSFDAFIKEYRASCTNIEALAIILDDAGHRHEHLAKMKELILLISNIQNDRLEQRHHVQILESTYGLFMTQLDELSIKIQRAMSNDGDHIEDSTYFEVDIEEMKSNLRYFDQQCLGDTLYPDTQQHTLLPHAYILDLMDSNRQVRQYINQLQDSLSQRLKTIVDSNSVFTDLLPLLQEQVRLQERCQDCHKKISAISSDHTFADEPVPDDLNSTLVLVHCLSVQSEVQALSGLGHNITEKLCTLATRLLQHNGTKGSCDSFKERSSTVTSMAKKLGLAFHKLVSTTLAMHLRQIWETRWKSSKEKLEQCLSQLDSLAHQERLVDSRCSSIDSAEQVFREIVQTDIASTNFAFRNLSKAYNGLLQGEGILVKLQQKHSELRRLMTKIDSQLAKMRGYGEHMNSRARKLSNPNSLEVRARKISLPSRKTSNLGGFSDHLVASRSAVVSGRSSSSRSRGSISSRSGHKSSRPMYIPDPANVLDVEVGRIINESPYRICVKAVPGEVGRYWFGEVQPKLAYCRILKSSMVMVRVGGGWTELTQFLRDHALLEENFIPRERSFTEDEGLREGFIKTHRTNAPLGRTIKTHSSERGIKDGDRFIVGNGIEVKMTRAQDERTVPRSSRVNLLQN